MREVAGKVGITERAVHSIIKDLEEIGVISITKMGRRNCYAIDRDVPLRHQIESHRNISDLLEFFRKSEGGS